MPRRETEKGRREGIRKKLNKARFKISLFKYLPLGA